MLRAAREVSYMLLPSLTSLLVFTHSISPRNSVKMYKKPRTIPQVLELAATPVCALSKHNDVVCSSPGTSRVVGRDLWALVSRIRYAWRCSSALDPRVIPQTRLRTESGHFGEARCPLLCSVA